MPYSPRLSIGNWQSAIGNAAFSLIEIMITVALLTVIVLGLLATFNQVVRAFRSSMTQTDILEAGRATTDMIQRELEQLTPSQAFGAINFSSEPSPPAAPAVFYQDLPPITISPPPKQRANVFQHFFFLTRENLTWTGIGYLVSTPNSGVGTLYRFQAQTNSAVGSLASQFQRAAIDLYNNNLVSTNLMRIADGVVHLRVTAYNTSGYLLTNSIPNTFITYVPPPAIQGKDFRYYFYSNAVPAYVELEIGFLEDRTLARFKSIPNVNNAPQNYLKDHSAQVHLFRQRIPIRNVDFSAYQ